MKLYKSLAIGVIALSSFAAAAQNSYSGYFIENNLYRHTLNPAFGHDYGYVSMPVLGDFNLALRGNLNLTDILYSVDGRTTTFMSPKVSAEQAMSNFEANNRLNFATNLRLLTIAFKGIGGYNTIEIGARANFGASLPKEIFSFLKEGISNQVYDISDISARANTYAEIALGHSHNIGEKFRVGAKMKFLVGAANIDARLNKAHLALHEDNWQILANATINSSLKGLSYTTEYDSDSRREYVDGFAIDSNQLGVAGFGLAFDLGATYQITKDLQVSAALLDLGFIAWNNNIEASTNGDQEFNTNAYEFSFNGDSDYSFDSQFEKMGEDITRLYQLSNNGDKGSRTTSLATTLNVGVEYALPVYRNLKFGLVNTTRFAGVFTATEFRLSANIQPAKAFSAGINLAAGTYGVGFGWIINVCPKGFNLFVAMDNTVTKLAKQYVPLNSNAAFNVGINFPF
ncbi:MAG: hypothetical protein J6R27_02745 [Muribaculaceae bacterium]|nr:hypothetical protein [Muribaculaceae bacterium]